MFWVRQRNGKIRGGEGERGGKRRGRKGEVKRGRGQIVELAADYSLITNII